VQAIAVLPGDRNSAIASALYVIPQTPTPTISPASGLYPAGQSISITDSDGSAVIYYTTDGTPPTISSHVYAGSLSFNGLSETIQAVALSPGKSASATAGTTYVISQVPMPTISPNAGIYGPGQLISITDVDSGAQIRFTTDGSTPSPSSNLYTGPFFFEGPSETVNAIALPTTAGQANSATASATYEFPGTIFAVNDTAAPGVAPWIYFPEGVALDSQGNLYVSDTYDTRVVKIAPNGILTTVIGNWQYATCGDGGPASGACILSPLGLAVDGAGNLYIATDNRIRRVDTQGIVTTVAGTGAAGYSKDGIPATSATLDNPVGVAADSAGNFYISNQNDCRIRKVNTSGIISTVAGEGICGFSGDGRLATHAQMSHGYGITLDAAGNLYFADSGNARVRRVDAVTGIITTVAGNGTVGYGGDGGPATSGEFNLPCGVAVDAQGNLYIADNNNQRIRKVTPAGIVTTVAGNGTGGGSGDGGPAIDAELSNPLEIALDDQGTLYIADVYNGVRKVTPGTAP
jgi:sugar lactone lactonase YvrE